MRIPFKKEASSRSRLHLEQHNTWWLHQRLLKNSQRKICLANPLAPRITGLSFANVTRRDSKILHATNNFLGIVFTQKKATEFHHKPIPTRPLTAFWDSNAPLLCSTYGYILDSGWYYFGYETIWDSYLLKFGIWMLYTWINCWKREEVMEWITLEKIKKLKVKFFNF